METRFTLIDNENISKKENEILIFGQYKDNLNPFSKFDKDGDWDKKAFLYFPPLAFNNACFFMSYHVKINGRERWIRLLLPSRENVSKMINKFRYDREKIREGMDFLDIMRLRFGDNPINEFYGYSGYIHRVLYDADNEFIKLVYKQLRIK